MPNEERSRCPPSGSAHGKVADYCWSNSIVISAFAIVFLSIIGGLFQVRAPLVPPTHQELGPRSAATQISRPDDPKLDIHQSKRNATRHIEDRSANRFPIFVTGKPPQHGR